MRFMISAALATSAEEPDPKLQQEIQTSIYLAFLTLSYLNWYIFPPDQPGLNWIFHSLLLKQPNLINADNSI